MKWITFRMAEQQELGWVCRAGNKAFVIPLRKAAKYMEREKLQYPEVVLTMLDLLKAGEEVQLGWRNVAGFIQEQPLVVREIGVPFNQIRLHAPISDPVSIRNFSAFDDNKNSFPDEWYEIPAFYFSNPRSIYGPGEGISRPKQCKRLDYELELACVIGKEGRDLSVKEAENYIFGYMILNDWSARDFQQKEGKIGLGFGKGKDFATSLGPFLVTGDELLPFRSDEGRFDLEMKAFINGKELSRGNFRNIFYTFAEMIAHASKDVTLHPGDIISSGPVESGCILELGEDKHPWLKEGDRVTLSITGLGVLHNFIIS